MNREIISCGEITYGASTAIINVIYWKIYGRKLVIANYLLKKGRNDPKTPGGIMPSNGEDPSHCAHYGMLRRVPSTMMMSLPCGPISATI